MHARYDTCSGLHGNAFNQNDIKFAVLEEKWPKTKAINEEVVVSPPPTRLLRTPPVNLKQVKFDVEQANNALQDAERRRQAKLKCEAEEKKRKEEEKKRQEEEKKRKEEEKKRKAEEEQRKAKEEKKRKAEEAKVLAKRKRKEKKERAP